MSYGNHLNALNLYLQEKPPQPPHHPALVRALAKEVQCEPADIVDFELNVCDTVPGTIGGGSSIFHPHIHALHPAACRRPAAFCSEKVPHTSISACHALSQVTHRRNPAIVPAGFVSRRTVVHCVCSSFPDRDTVVACVTSALYKHGFHILVATGVQFTASAHSAPHLHRAYRKVCAY